MLTVSSDEIRCRVEKLRRQFQTSDPFILCRQLDVQLKGVNFGETEHSIKAMTTVIFRIRMIQYNSNLPRTLLTFILAHELGHILLHSREIKTFQETETTLYETNRLETEANRFAAELLLGDSASFYREMQDSDYTLFQIAAVHHVPYDFLAYKLQMMEEEGYPVPELPAEPDSRCLGGYLGLPDCYGFYEE